MDSDGDFHSAPSSPCKDSKNDMTVEFSGDEEDPEDNAVFHNVIEELITDLSSQEKETCEKLPDPTECSQQSSQHSLQSSQSQSSSPDFMPASSQRVLTDVAASRLFIPCLSPTEEDGAGDVTNKSVGEDGTDTPFNQLYLDQCCEWFKRGTRSVSKKDQQLYAGIESGIRYKKRKQSDK